MSDLRPTGVEVNLGSAGKRHFLFTLNVIESLESTYDKPMFDILDEMFTGENKNEVTRTVVHTLLEDECEREKWENPQSTIENVDKRELGWLITVDNMEEIKLSVLRAFGISMPENAEDEGPNVKSSQSD